MPKENELGLSIICTVSLFLGVGCFAALMWWIWPPLAFVLLGVFFLLFAKAAKDVINDKEKEKK